MNLLLSVDGRRKVKVAFENAGLIAKGGSSGYITIEQFSQIEKATKEIQEHLQGLDSNIPPKEEDVDRITEIDDKYESITLKLQRELDALPSSENIITANKLTEELKDIKNTISNLPSGDNIITNAKLTDELNDQFIKIGEAFKNKLAEELKPIQDNDNGFPNSNSIITDTKLTEALKDIKNTISNLPSGSTIITDTKLTEELKDIKETILKLPETEKIITDAKLTEELKDMKKTLLELPETEKIMTTDKFAEYPKMDTVTEIYELYRKTLNTRVEPIETKFEAIKDFNHESIKTSVTTLNALKLAEKMTTLAEVETTLDSTIEHIKTIVERIEKLEDQHNISHSFVKPAND